MESPDGGQRTPLRPESSITAFDRRAGDPSRGILIAVLGMVILSLVGTFVFTGGSSPESPSAPAEKESRLPPATAPESKVSGNEGVSGKEIGQGRDGTTPPGAGEALLAASPGTVRPAPNEPAEPTAAGAGADTTASPGGDVPQSSAGRASAATFDPNTKRPRGPDDRASPAIPPKAAETPPEPEGPGTLTLSVDPAVDVYEGQTRLGRTPLTATLPEGRHQLRFSDKPTGINVYRTYTIRPGGKHSDQVTIGSAMLVLDAPAGSTVTLNSRTIGTTPLEPVTIFEGRHQLKVVYQGLTWSQSFSAKAGTEIKYNVTYHQGSPPPASPPSPPAADPSTPPAREPPNPPTEEPPKPE